MKHSFKTNLRVIFQSLVWLIVVVTGFRSGVTLASVPGITGGRGTPVFNLVASAGTSSQPDGASVYTWGYGCGKAGAAPGASVAAAPAG